MTAPRSLPSGSPTDGHLRHVPGVVDVPSRGERGEPPHAVTAALLAERDCVLSARLAAAPQATNVAATASTSPRMFARNFISVRFLRVVAERNTRRRVSRSQPC